MLGRPRVGDAEYRRDSRKFGSQFCVYQREGVWRSAITDNYCALWGRSPSGSPATIRGTPLARNVRDPSRMPPCPSCIACETEATPPIIEIRTRLRRPR